MNSYLLLIAGILIILSAFASRISTRFGIPVLLIFMGIGILAGPDFLNPASTTEELSALLNKFIAVPPVSFSYPKGAAKA